MKFIQAKNLRTKKEKLLKIDKIVKKVLGNKIYGTEIYYVECCVYLNVSKELYEKGRKSWLIYDVFYV